MATAPNLPTDVAPGDPDHAALHNDVNASVNALTKDTGWRNLVATNGLVMIRRVGDMVTLTLDPAASGMTSSVINIVPMPVGFQPRCVPPHAFTSFPLVADDGSPNGVFNVPPDLSGTFQAQVDLLDFVWGVFSWPTDAAYPTTLPGTPYTP